jgi:hypothetical protein
MELQQRLVRRALRSVDPDLYLEEEWSSLGFPYWAIKYPIGEGIEPLRPVAWLNNGKPLPLSLSIVDKLRHQEGDITEAITQAKATNIAIKEKARAERMAVQEDLIQEYHRWDKRGFVKVPKGVKQS